MGSYKIPTIRACREQAWACWPAFTIQEKGLPNTIAYQKLLIIFDTKTMSCIVNTVRTHTHSAALEGDMTTQTLTINKHVFSKHGAWMKRTARPGERYVSVKAWQLDPIMTNQMEGKETLRGHQSETQIMQDQNRSKVAYNVVTKYTTRCAHTQHLASEKQEPNAKPIHESLHEEAQLSRTSFEKKDHGLSRKVWKVQSVHWTQF